MSPEKPLVMVAEYTFPRWKAVVYGVLVGLLIGYGNTFLEVDFTLRADLLVALVIVAIVIVVVVHEGLHGGAGLLLRIRSPVSRCGDRNPCERPRVRTERKDRHLTCTRV